VSSSYLTHPRLLIEHWTDAGLALILEGAPDVIGDVAHMLALPNSRVVLVNPDCAVLGLWGDDLTSYLASSLARQYDANGGRLSSSSGQYSSLKRSGEFTDDCQPEPEPPGGSLSRR
jgi:hypothetical protein